MPMLERPISKAGWTRVAFGDVVRLSKARVADPEAAGIERVVGLEHIEPGDLRIRRWGDVADGTTFTTLFKPGQVLFGKRRAYQRKVAVADFEGVCSGDIYVLEPANDRLMPELLPFLCQTDAFFDHAVGTSAGSLSPRTNWTSLASFECMLPPIQEQARVVAGIVAAHDAVEKLNCAVEAQKALAQSALLQALNPLTRPSVKIGDVAIRVTNGFVGSAVKHYVKDGIPYLRSLNVRRSGLDLADMVYISQEFHEATLKSQLREGDVLTVQSGHVGETAVVPKSCVGWNCHALILTRLDLERINPEYLAIYLNSEIGQRHLQRFFVGSTVAHLNTSDLEKLVIPFPSLAEQIEIAELGRSLLKSGEVVSQRLDSARAMSRQMLEQALSGADT
jgi:type I restriction enzyme, S subunit